MFTEEDEEYEQSCSFQKLMIYFLFFMFVFYLINKCVWFYFIFIPPLVTSAFAVSWVMEMT